MAAADAGTSHTTFRRNSTSRIHPKSTPFVSSPSLSLSYSIASSNTENREVFVLMNSRISIRSLLLVAIALIAFAHGKKADGDFSPTKCANPMKVNESVAADKVSKKEIRDSLIPAQKKNAYYFNGNGRVWSQVFRVSKGQCLGCTDPTLFRPLGEGKTQFCDIDSVMAGVAANYWKGKCAPSSVKSTLQRFSTSGFHSQAVTFDAQYRSTCGKKSKTILVTGRSSDAVESENVYASIEQSGGYGGSGMQWSYGGGYWTRPY